MPEPLKNHFSLKVAKDIAVMVKAADPQFKADSFVRAVADDYEPLELMQRGWKIADALHAHLPDDYETAISILMKSLGPKLEKTEDNGMAPFLYMPHVFYVARYGLEHFDLSMHAQYELTQRFTAEFSIRPYIERYPKETLSLLKKWTKDDSPHVRRLVSEGTRPRLPWAPRLRAFQENPRPVLDLLELLKDDSALYVRRSVANNLNDIGKDHPDLLMKTAQDWIHQTDNKNRRWLVRHALRSAVKRGDKKALTVLGFGQKTAISVRKKNITPKRARMGSAVTISFKLVNTGAKPQRVLVDFCVYFMKANSKRTPKVFKLKTVTLKTHEKMDFKKKISLKKMTTRKLYPGKHVVEVILNGHKEALGAFVLLD